MSRTPTFLLLALLLLLSGNAVLVITASGPEAVVPTKTPPPADPAPATDNAELAQAQEMIANLRLAIGQEDARFWQRIGVIEARLTAVTEQGGQRQAGHEPITKDELVQAARDAEDEWNALHPRIPSLAEQTLMHGRGIRDIPFGKSAKNARLFRFKR